MMKRLLTIVAGLAMAGAAGAADPALPTNEVNAIELKADAKEIKSTEVTLYQDGTNEAWICYYKMTLKKGTPYTVWLEGPEALAGNIYIDWTYPKISTSETQIEPEASFDIAECGEEVRWIVDGKTWGGGWAGDGGWVDGGDAEFDWGDDDWGEDDWGDFEDWPEPTVPSSWTYYIIVKGVKGATATLKYVARNELPVGLEQNPLKIDPVEGWTQAQAPDETDPSGKRLTTNLLFKSQSYYVSVKVTRGRRYYFTVGGGVSADDYRTIAGLENGDLTRGAPAAPVNAYNDSVCYIPEATTTEVFRIVSTNGFGSVATLRYRVDPSRKITDPSRDVTTLPLTGGQAEDEACEPGWLNDPAEKSPAGNEYFDEIIDQQLYKFTAAKKTRYVIDTEGATTNLLMRLYDEKGNLISSNTTKGEGSLDVRCIVDTLSNNTTLYVGVCQLLEPFSGNEPKDGETVKLSIRAVTIDESETILNPLPAAVGEFVLDVDTDGRGPNTLDDTRWYNTFTIEGRGPVAKNESGVAYTLATTFEDPETPVTNGLWATVYWLSGKTKKPVAEGDLTPGYGSLSFVADANRTYYVRVEPAAGFGMDCADYRIHSIAQSAEHDIGSLWVTPKGAAAATWQIAPVTGGKLKYETLKYGVDESIILPVGKYSVKYGTVKGYAKPDPETFECEVTKGAVTHLVNTYYNDANDPKDNTMSGATAWTLKNTPTTTTGRNLTLWGLVEGQVKDPLDHYAVTAKAGYLYGFDLSDVTGDAVFSVLDKDGKVITSDYIGEVSRTNHVQKLKLPAGKCYVRVEHENSPAVDGTYELDGYFKNVGQFKLSKAAVSFKENVAYATITVNRTAADGRVKLYYETEDGTAKMAVDGAHGEYLYKKDKLEWADGDKKAKTISIKLVPDLKPTYEGVNKQFYVNVWTEVPAYDSDEYPIEIARADKTVGTTDKATVTLTEVSKATPGTVVAADYDAGAGAVEISNPKKAAASVTAGKTLKLNLERTVGINGAIAVKATLTPGKGLTAAGYALTSPAQLDWADGESGTKQIEIKTAEFGANDYTESKTLTVKIAKAVGSPKIDTASITVTILNEHLQKSMATYTKGLAKNAPVTVKEAKAGTWFVDADGSFKCVPITDKQKTAALTFTVTGPGRLKLNPTVPAGATLECKVGKATEAWTSGEKTLYLAAGKQTVTLTATRLAGASADPQVSFGIVADGAPFQWTALPAAVAMAPTEDKATVMPGDVELKFRREAGISYRVYLMKSGEKAKSAATGKAMKLGDPETEVTEVSDAFTTNLEVNVKYTWRADSFFEGGSVTNTAKNGWTLTTATDAAVTADLRTTVDGKDAYGNDVAGAGEIVRLVQGVKADVLLGTENDRTTVSYALAGGKLPDGVKIVKTAIKSGKTVTGYTTKLSGTPTKVGKYSAVLQITDNKVKGATVALDFEVEAIDYAAGTFNGLLAETNDKLDNEFQTMGTIAFTATAAGKLSAKISIGGKSYSASDTGYAKLTVNEAPASDEFKKTLTAELSFVQKVANVPHTNRVTVIVGHGVTTNLTDLGKIAGEATLKMDVPTADGKAVTAGVEYGCPVYRDNTKSKDYLAALADYVGYYTVALPIKELKEGCPSGNGYVTLTLDAKGKCKTAGMLADGTTVSSSLLPALVGDLSMPGNCTLIAPVYQAKTSYVFGGELRFRMESVEGPDVTDLWPVADKAATLRWANDDATKDYFVEQGGWNYELVPAGGWYDKIYSLQTYYRSGEFEVNAGTSDNLPDELLPTSKYGASKWVTEIDTLPTGEAVDLAGDTMSVAKQALVKDPVTKQYVWTDSANASKLSLSFKRATGLVSGTFGVWAEVPNAKGGADQKFVSGAKHYGVLPLVFADGALDEDVLTAGFFNWQVSAPYKSGTKTVSRKWTYSAPFNIKRADPE